MCVSEYSLFQMVIEPARKAEEVRVTTNLNQDYRTLFTKN